MDELSRTLDRIDENLRLNRHRIHAPWFEIAREHAAFVASSFSERPPEGRQVAPFLRPLPDEAQR